MSKQKFWVFGIIGLILVIAFFGCRKKSQEMPIPSTEPTTVTIIPEPTKEVVSAPITQPAPEKTEVTADIAVPTTTPPPSVVPTRPTNEEIQIALKNAGLYTGKIDGKIGPQSKKAIETFQKQNNLVVDGKVGPKTWSLLQKYLTSKAQEPTD